MTGGGDFASALLFVTVSPMHNIASGPTAPTTCRPSEYSFSCSCLNLCINCKQFTDVNCNSSDHKLKPCPVSQTIALLYLHRWLISETAYYCTAIYTHSVLYTFALICIKRISYSNVCGWVAGCPSQPVLYQND